MRQNARPARDRRHLTGSEVDKLLDATQSSCHAARDRCLVLLLLGFL